MGKKVVVIFLLLLMSNALGSNPRRNDYPIYLESAVISTYKPKPRPVIPKKYYDTINIKASRYEPVAAQCFGDYTRTGSGKFINFEKLKSRELRWLAVSKDIRIKHKIKYGDAVEIISDNEVISGTWIVEDSMHPRVEGYVDLLSYVGDRLGMKAPTKIKLIIERKK